MASRGALVTHARHCGQRVLVITDHLPCQKSRFISRSEQCENRRGYYLTRFVCAAFWSMLFNWNPENPWAFYKSSVNSHWRHCIYV